MLSLPDTQSRFRQAIADGTHANLLPLLRSPGDPLERLGIYRRHYRESFRRHLRGRFPTLEWLIGTDRIVEIADRTLRDTPPHAPSLAEYGYELIDTLVRATADGLPAYLPDVARLDWHLGSLSVATVSAPLYITALAEFAPETLADAALTLQPGLAYLEADWPVDELIHLRLSGSVPDQLTFNPLKVSLELRGGRGSFSLQRLTIDDYAFRGAISSGSSLASAAEMALATDGSFELATALARLFAEGLVISLVPPQQESNP